MYQWFLTFRYLFSRAIPFAALVVVASSVALLIVIVSVMEGFRAEHQEKIRGTSADIQVTANQYINLKDSELAMEVIDKVPGVVASAPFLDTLVLYRPESARSTVPLETRYMRAVDMNRNLRLDVDQEGDSGSVGGFGQYIKDANHLEDLGFREVPDDPRGFFSDEWLEEGLWKATGQTNPFEDGERPLPVVIGREQLRDRPPLRPGQVISLTAFSPTTQLPVTRDFIIAGYFKTGIYDLDARGILMGIESADEFLGLTLPDGRRLVSGVRIVAEPEHRAESPLIELRKKIEAALDEAEVYFVRVQTWREEKAALLRALKVEKALTSFILGLTVLFGGFMIFIILTVQVVEKTRDIGVLQSMGATPWGTAGVFFRIGMVLCTVGTVIGGLYGLGFAYFVNDIQRWVKLLTGIEVFPLTIFYMDEIPVQFELSDLCFIIVPTVVMSMAASLLPAFRAARKRPVDALRYE